MALYKYHYIELDTKRSPRISLQNIVAGETGNRIWITVTNNGETVDMSEKENGEFIYRVCLKIDSDIGTRRQDSSMENSGISFIEAATGDHGKINILLSKDSFAAGMNRARLEIFSKRSADNDTLICSAEWTFRAAQNPSGENAGSVYPSLISLENELEQLKTDTTAAKDAANSAASSANDAATLANTKAGLADTAATAANNAATDADHAAQEAYTRGADASAAASAANAAAAAATAAAELMQQTFYNVPLRNPSSWDDDPKRLYYINVTLSKLQTIMQNSRLVVVITDPNDNPITLYEFMRTDQYVGFHSPANVSGVYYTASLDYTASPITRTLTARQKMMNTPTQASVSNGVITFKDANSTSLFTVTLPVYNGGVS